MWTAAQIKRHIARLPSGQIFTTRELLCYGYRAAVDQTLYRLVNSGSIKRLARGVFIASHALGALPTPFQVASAKARAFAKEVFCYGRDAARSLGFHQAAGGEVVYATNGATSSFVYGGIVIHLRRLAPRKTAMGDGQVGLVIRALWYFGKDQCDQVTTRKATSAFGRNERLEVTRHAGLMPGWMTVQLLINSFKPWTGKDERKRLLL